jgi:hypothetical protein
MIGSASKMTGFDVKHPLRIAALDASIGRRARLEESPREGPECAPKPAFHCEREIGFTGRQCLLLACLTGSAMPAFRRFSSVHRVNLEGQQRVDLTRSPHRLAMTAICAKETAGVDVKRSVTWIPTSKAARITDRRPST